MRKSLVNLVFLLAIGNYSRKDFEVLNFFWKHLKFAAYLRVNFRVGWFPAFSNSNTQLHPYQDHLANLLDVQISQYLTNVHILHPLKTPENQIFSGVFTGY